jgi:hypothetical protein
MPNNREIYQSAKVLIDKYGEDGAIDHCDHRIIRLVGEREMDGAEIWKGIRVAVRHLIDGAPGPDEIVH